MVWTRLGSRRALLLTLCLALALMLLGAREARSGKYDVAQCGWMVGIDADWADTTGGVKFRPDSWCVPPSGDPFAGVHVKSFTRNAGTVSGNRFGRWRWLAPPTTGITRISGTWWQTLHDGIEQRIGSLDWNGNFTPFATASSTNVALRNFVFGFASPRAGIEDRLLCARGADKWCSLQPASWSSLRALTLTVQDDVPPAAGVSGELVSGGWRRGHQGLGFWGNDAGAGVRFGETTIDGSRVLLHEYGCAKAAIGSEWRATRMQPCGTIVSASGAIWTTAFSDGPHTLGHCAVDFAGNPSCIAPVPLLIDNNPPTGVRNLRVGGADGWRRVNDFDISWQNPGQGPASPIAAAHWRITGPNGYDGGAHQTSGRDIAAIADRRVPGPGTYRFHVWLRDEAGNFNAENAEAVQMRFDDVSPGVAFEPLPDDVPGKDAEELPKELVAEVADAHSGAAAGTILYRRRAADQWTELPTRYQAGSRPGSARLSAKVPESLEPGTYVFRVEATDVAGNRAATSRRTDGTEVTLRKPSPPVAPARPAKPAENPARADRPATAAAAVEKAGKTRLFAKLRAGGRAGSALTVPFKSGAKLTGRLTTAVGTGLAGRPLRVVARPSRGALARPRVETVHTGPRGAFRLALQPGTSRRVTVSFAGERFLAPSRRPALALRVKGSAILHAGPRQLRTGEVLRLWGRVRTRGATLPRRGKLIAIQYYERAARRWRPVLVTRTDHDGRFRARYRFRYLSGEAQIRLRAIALAEERWPYAPGGSPPLQVRVRGPVG